LRPVHLEHTPRFVSQCLRHRIGLNEEALKINGETTKPDKKVAAVASADIRIEITINDRLQVTVERVLRSYRPL
jgi:hypothetical protein